MKELEWLQYLNDGVEGNTSILRFSTPDELGGLCRTPFAPGVGKSVTLLCCRCATHNRNEDSNERPREQLRILGEGASTVLEFCMLHG